MHIAICDDHFADRKQMERLLDRESDRRLSSSGVLYVDSYGSEGSILVTPMIYDAIFMDMTEDCDGVELANKLRSQGTIIPIVFCCGKVNYRSAPNLPDNVFFLDKPILVSELSEMVDQLLSIKSRQVKRLEFRNSKETFYIEEKELLYALQEGDYEMKLHLINGEDRIAQTNLQGFCANAVTCASYIELANHAILNMDHIREVSQLQVTMTDGKSFRLRLGEKRSLQKAMDEYKNEQEDS